MKSTSTTSLFGAVALAVLGILAGQFALLSYFESRRQASPESAATVSELPFDWDRDLAGGENELQGSLRLNPGKSADELWTLDINPENLDLPEEEPEPSRSVPTPAELPHLEDAAPISEKLKAEEPLIRSIIRKELPNATKEEQDIWLDRLRGMAFEEMRFLLQMRKQDLLELRPTLEKFRSATSPEKHTPVEQPPPVTASPPPPSAPVTAGLKHPVLQGDLLEVVQGSLKSLQAAQRVILNNIANAGTTGFKRSEALFENLAYRTAKNPGIHNNNGKFTPAGLSVGFGTRIASIRVDYRQGRLIETGGELDLAITGDGFFKVTDGNETLYTRAGAFNINADGDIVLSSSDQARLLDPLLTIPQGVTQISISADGTVAVLQTPLSNLTQLGQIQIVRFLNPRGLIQRGENLFAQSDASGPPQEGVPGVDGRGTLKQGFLEASNVDLTFELIEWHKLQNQWRVLSHIAGLLPAETTPSGLLGEPLPILPLATPPLTLNPEARGFTKQ